MTRALLLILCLVTLPACSDDEPTTVVFVTVDGRAGVSGLSELVVRVDNDNANTTDTFNITGRSLPLTFTVTPKGREGVLSITVTGRDGDGIEKGRGQAEATIVVDDRVDVAVLLDPSDFVVNTKISGNQRVTFTPEENSKQLALNPADGSFAVVFEDDCGMLNRCDIFMRLFDADGTPRVNQVNMDATAFIANLTNDGFRLGPAVAHNSGNYFVVWEAQDSINGVIISANGEHLVASEILISAGAMTPTSAAVAPLGNGGFVVTWAEWSQIEFGNVVRGRLFNASGTPLPNPVSNDDGPFAISLDETIAFAGTSVAASGSDREFAVVFRDDDNVYARFFDAAAAPTTAAEIRLTNHSTSAAVLAPHVVWNQGQTVISWGVIDPMNPALNDGVLQIAQYTSPNGSRVAPVVSLATSDGSFFNLSSPALSVRDDGLLVTSWHNCGASGDGDDCGVLLQLMRPSGLPVGNPQVINTTRTSAQTVPSVVARTDAVIGAWTDRSQQAPDTSNDAVRARLVFVDTEINNGELGARCGRPQDTACAAELVCIPGGEAVPYCHTSCDPAGTPPQCPDGGVCTTVGESSGCVF